MSLYDEIINGTFKNINIKKDNQKDNNIYDQIINGTYENLTMKKFPVNNSIETDSSSLSKNETSVKEGQKNMRPLSNNKYVDNFTPYVKSKNKIKEGSKNKYKDPHLPTNQSNNLNPNSVLMNDISNKTDELKYYEKEFEKKEKIKGNDAGLGLLKSTLALTNYLGQGALKYGESILDTALQLGTSKLNPYYLFNQDELKSHQQIAKDLIQENAVEQLVNTLSGNENFNKNVLDKESLVKSDNLAGQIAQGIGNMLPSILIGNNVGNAGSTISLGANSYGGGLEEAYNDGANRGQANLYGIGNAGLEMATEWLTGGIPGTGGKTGLDNIAEKGMNKIGNQVLKETARAGYKMLGEGVEEMASEYFNPYLKEFIYKGNKDDFIIDKIVNAHNNVDWNAVKESAIAGTITGGILEAPVNVMNIRNGDLRQSQINSNNQIAELQNQNSSSISNQLKSSVNEPTDNLREQNNILEGKDFVNSKINSFRKSAKQYLDDSVKSRNFQKIAEKLIYEKNYNIVVDSNISNESGNFVNAQINTLNNGEIEIRINPNSPKAGEFLLVHEITHSIETDGMKELILNYASKHEDFNESLNELQKIYNTNDVSSEVIADISGELFGKQEFINSLSIEKPSIFKQIYNKIIELANRLTGNAHEALFMRDLKQKWETAYRTKSNNLTNVNYSIQQDSNGKSFVNIDTDQHIFDGISIKDYNKIAKMYINDYLKGNTTLSYNDTAIIDSKSANKYTNPGKKQPNFIEKMKLTPELKNVLNIAEKYNTSLPIKDNSKYSNWEYYKFNFKLGNQAFEGTVNIGVDSAGNKHFYEVNNIKKTSGISDVSPNRPTGFSDGNIPQSNNFVKSDILPKYSMQNDLKNANKWQEYLDSHYKTDGTKTYFEDIRFSEKSETEVLPKYSQKNENLNSPKNISKKSYSKELSNIINSNSQNIEEYIIQERPDLKIRKWVETSTESQVVNNEIKPEELDIRKITYEIKSNKSSLEKANRILDMNGIEKSIEQFNSEYESNKLPKAEDIVLGERLIQETLKQKNYELAGELIEKVAILGTELGQATQALSLIQRLTPEGQLGMLQKTVNRMKKKNIKGVENLNVTKEMVEEILSVRKDDGSFDMNELDNAVEKVKQELGQQLPATVMDKLNGWRYLSMLGNPKTHIRNIVSNIAMKGTLSIKNTLASGIEDIFLKKSSDRTKTLKRATEVVSEFAKQDAIDMRNIISGDDKYSMSSQIEKEKQIFKTKWIEKVSNLNSDLLEAEDWMFSRKAYENAFKNYLTANNIKTKSDIENNSSIIEKGRLYAVEEAKKATFRQESKIARQLNKIERMNKGTEFLVGATLPYKKTPINIAKTGVNYSLIGLGKTLSLDIYNLKKGNITANQFIDNISQGLTGGSLTLLGFYLSQIGLLNGSSGDDKEDKYNSQLGKQAYSINAFGHTYTLDWLSPSAIPLFTGVEIQRMFEDNQGIDGNVIMDSITQKLDPMTSMSVLQGINNSLKSYGKNKLQGIAEESIKSYVGQYFPTIGGQIAKTIDPYQRSTTASKNSSFKLGEEIVRSNMAKIPGASYLLQPATDVWGNAKKRGNILQRTAENFISPGYLKKIVETDVDKELKNLYSQNSNKGVLPGNYTASLTYKEKNYKMSAKEFTKYKKQYGNTAYKVINDIIKSNNYKKSDVKENMIEDAYTYAREMAKKDYFNSKGIKYESKNQKWVQEIEGKISPDKYISFKKNDIDLIKGDKNEDGNIIKGTSTGKKAYKIVNSKLLSELEKNFLLSDITTAENPVSLSSLKKLKNDEEVFKYYYGLTKRDTFDNVVINGNMNQEVYIDVKQYVSDVKKNYDDTKKRRELIYQYIQNKKISKIEKIMLYGMSGYSISNYKDDMFKYINSLNLSKSEKEELYYYFYTKKGSE